MIPAAFDEDQYNRALGTVHRATGFVDSSEPTALEHWMQSQFPVEDCQTVGAILESSTGLTQRVILSSQHYQTQTELNFGLRVSAIYPYFYDQSAFPVCKAYVIDPNLVEERELSEYSLFDRAKALNYVTRNPDLLEALKAIPGVIQELVTYSRIELRLLVDIEEDWENLGIFVHTNEDDFDNLLRVESEVIEALVDRFSTDLFERINITLCPR